MKYIVDNDLHIHSKQSLCGRDPEQIPERILQYAKDNGFNTVCLTDHFWDEKVKINGTGHEKDGFYALQDFKHISEMKPLPQAEGIRFLFGCETELDFLMTLGVSKERMDEFDFIVIPTTHFHMLGYTLTAKQWETAQGRAKAWVDRFEAVLNMDLPFEKIGFAHLTCGLIARNKEEFFEVLGNIPESEMKRLFTLAASKGAGIELNAGCLYYCENDEDISIALKPYKIAKKCGCKFYCASDAHHPNELDSAKPIFEKIVGLLELNEEDKFKI